MVCRTIGGLSGGKSSKQHCTELLEAAIGKNLVCTWGGAKGETQQRWDWTEGGVEVLEPPISDVESGIDRVTQLLKERRIKVFRTCRGLLDEFATYRRKPDSSGQPTEEIEQKRRYHHLDSLRYLVSGLTGGGQWVGGAVAGGERDSAVYSPFLDAGRGSG